MSLCLPYTFGQEKGWLLAVLSVHEPKLVDGDGALIKKLEND